MSLLPKNIPSMLYATILAGMSISFAFAQESQKSRHDTTTTAPAGEPKTPKMRMLEAGAMLLQSTTPLKSFDIYLVGFHPMKDHPEHQMEAHHYCQQVNEDFAQCMLFDSARKDANLNGIDYIISDKLFQ